MWIQTYSLPEYGICSPVHIITSRELRTETFFSYKYLLNEARLILTLCLFLSSLLCLVDSFVLVEVGGLGCAVSVNFLSTPSPDSCASWVSALRETQVLTFLLQQTHSTPVRQDIQAQPWRNVICFFQKFRTFGTFHE